MHGDAPLSRLRALIEALQAPVNAEASHLRADVDHRWIFAAAREAMLILDARTRLRVEVNLAAAELLGRPRAALVGSTFPRGLERASAAQVDALLAQVAEHACPTPVTMRAFDGGGELRMTASQFSTESGAFVLVRLSAAHGTEHVPLSGIAGAPTLALIQDAGVPIVLTDLMLNVEFANRAFRELAGLAGDDEPAGRSLTRWLDLTEDDLRSIAAQAEMRQATLSLATTLRAENNATRAVSACVVVVPDGELPCCAFLIEDDLGRAARDARSDAER